MGIIPVDMPIPASLVDRTGALLVIAARTGQELATRRLAPMGLNVRLCGVLNRLAEGPVSQQELGEQLGIDRTTMVELIDELERQGAVVRRRNAAERRAAGPFRSAPPRRSTTLPTSSSALSSRPNAMTSP